MSNQFVQLMFFTKFLTGLILVLNIGLILSIRHNLRMIKFVNSLSADVKGTEERPPAPLRTLTVLVIAVIAINGAAVYGNMRLRSSVDHVTLNYGHLEKDLVQSTAKEK
jgi:hypothetical protein